MMEFILSVDLGQMSDYTAISLLQRAYRRCVAPTPRDIAIGAEGDVSVERIYRLVQLFRPPLRTPYTDISRQIRALMDTPQLAGKTDLVVDATGVGRPVIDIMRSLALTPIPITIGAGYAATKSDDGGYHVPKRDIASALQAIFQSRRISVASGLPLAEPFLAEMGAFTLKVKPSGAESFEAWRERDHDDLVLSVGMACWWASWVDPWRTVHNAIEVEDGGDYNPKSTIIKLSDKRRLTGGRIRAMY